MTDKEKIEKLRSLGWGMYNAYQGLTNDTSRIRKAMKAWWNFINHELNKGEQTINKTDEYLQEKIDSFTKAHKGEDPEEILADMRGQNLTIDDDLDRSAKLYRKYREECGYQDPVALNEIENAFYEGELRQKVRDRYKYRDVIEGTYDCDDETSWIYFDGWALSTSELGKKVKLIIVKENKL